MYKEKVKVLENEIIEKIKEKCSTIIGESDANLVFKSPFSVWVTVGMCETEGGERYVAKSILSDGTIIAESFGDDEEVSLLNLDIYELAYILDEIEEGNYKLNRI